MDRIVNLFPYILLSLILGCSADIEYCRVSDTQTTCPGPDDPYDFVICCVQENKTQYYCCQDHSLNNQLFVKISMAVTLTCLFVSVLLVVCCFWSRCPLFDWCWVNYSKRGNIAYLKDEEETDQPPNENDCSHKYVPLNVKVNQIEDV